jgi:hypothetical protein
VRRAGRRCDGAQKELRVSRRRSVRQFVVTRFATAFAIHQAVGAEAHLELRLAIHAEFFAIAARFRLLALSANDAADSWLSGHG